MTVAVGCAPLGKDTSEQFAAVDVSDPVAPPKPTGSQDCNLGERTVVRLSLQEEEFSHYLRVADVIPLWFDKDVPARGWLTLRVVVSSFDTPEFVFDLKTSIAPTDTRSAVAVRLSDLSLPTYVLPVSRQLRAHAIFAVPDGDVYEGGDVRLFFHPEADGWRFYDETVRKRDYWGGALTEAERQKRAAAFERLPAGVSAEYVNARVTKLSDDPEEIPRDDDSESDAAR